MDELEKIYQDFVQKRKMISTTMPSGSGSVISGGSVGVEFDFASLYPGVQKRYYKLKVMIRKKKIQRMFQSPS